MVRSRPTTDNFLPLTRGTSYYQPRPAIYAPRQAPAPPPNNRPLISDILPTAPQPALPKPRKRLMHALPIILVLLAGSLTGFELLSSQTKQIAPLQSVAAVRPSTASKQPSRVGLPVRLKIPKINVDASLDYVGLTSLGELDVPKDPASAGWYDQGPRPGEQGNAVIDGHFGWHDGIPAVFDNLHELQRGDKLYIEDKKGSTTTFTVRELQTFGQDETAPSVFNSNDKKAHLNLITCHGTWNNTQKSYSTRLVVFAHKDT